MASPLELDAMRRAIALSGFGIGTTSPNPPVGCVILDLEGRIGGEGHHERKGEAHAEALALGAAGVRAKGGTAVVTLEPCNHHGRTPPCHQALLDAGIVRTVVAVMDPTSRGEGGVARMRRAGMDVETDVLRDEALLVIGPWLGALRSRRPRVIWPYTLNLDGTVGSLSTVPDREELVTDVDLILDEDGCVTEGVVNSHGRGMQRFDPVPLPLDPHAILDHLYMRGARSVIIAGGLPFVRPFLSERLIDCVFGYLALGPASFQLAGRPELILLPPGLHLVQVGRFQKYVRVIGIRDDSPS